MHDYHPTILSADEYVRLQAMMCTMIGARTPLASLLRLKLGSAKVMPATEIGPDVVTADAASASRTAATGSTSGHCYGTRLAAMTTACCSAQRVDCRFWGSRQASPFRI